MTEVKASWAHRQTDGTSLESETVADRDDEVDNRRHHGRYVLEPHWESIVAETDKMYSDTCSGVYSTEMNESGKHSRVMPN